MKWLAVLAVLTAMTGCIGQQPFDAEEELLLDSCDALQGRADAPYSGDDLFPGTVLTGRVSERPPDEPRKALELAAPLIRTWTGDPYQRLENLTLDSQGRTSHRGTGWWRWEYHLVGIPVGANRSDEYKIFVDFPSAPWQAPAAVGYQEFLRGIPSETALRAQALVRDAVGADASSLGDPRLRGWAELEDWPVFWSPAWAPCLLVQPGNPRAYMNTAGHTTWVVDPHSEVVLGSFGGHGYID